MLEHVAGVAVLGVIAASGTGKTTLLRRVIPHLTADGLRVGCIKHTHHPFDIDQPGKDSYLLRAAGAEQMLLGSAGHWALMVDTGDTTDAPLAELIARLDLARLDVVLVEGFRGEDIPRIEVHRHELGLAPLCRDTANVVALATNQRPTPTVAVPILDLDDAAAIATFVAGRVRRFAPLRARGAHA
ncbi:MAG: molybdopterin-guanine dinucleotide biosynthesis protein B [Gammaproteobacteria bacterium]|nr:molybdopterin-guanine dinucleotide biosynthesis protein B [Gammaproteobacteria bacterium]MCP5201974.1 molybdopterin-guanine dinucleotide biosynthesis protein B [Gammaproteobacteria bacterium]